MHTKTSALPVRSKPKIFNIVFNQMKGAMKNKTEVALYTGSHLQRAT